MPLLATPLRALLLLVLPGLTASFLVLPLSSSSSSPPCSAARHSSSTTTNPTTTAAGPTLSSSMARTTRRHAATSDASPLGETLNGGWAGWECHFSLASGQVLPVPAEDLPEALREWEVEMWGWEGTTYDNVSAEEEEGKEVTCIDRKAARFMIEAGCGCENVGKHKSQPHFSPLHLAPDGAGYVASERLTASLVRLEFAFFSTSSCSSSTSSSEASSSSEKEQIRARVLVDLLTTTTITSSSSSSSSSPSSTTTTAPRDTLRLHLERRFTPSPPLDPDERKDPFKKSIDQTTISRRVVVPCFGDPTAKEGGKEGQRGLGRSGVWVAWREEEGKLEVGWAQARSIYFGGGGEGGKEGEMVWRARVDRATGGVKACEWGGTGTK